jgi:AbiU2
MRVERNADEARAEYVAKMGKDLGEVFHALSSELTWVHWRWKQYRILFGEKPTRIDLLNECAPHFFYIVQSVLFEDTLLGITRLVERSEMRDKSNLTVQKFPDLVKKDLKDDVLKLVNKAKESAGFAFDWRNRRIAHHDLDLALDRNARVLEPATRQKVEDSLLALRNVLDRIEIHYCNKTTAYNFSVTPGDAEDLLYVLRDGLQHRRDKDEGLERGEITAGDLEPGEEV